MILFCAERLRVGPNETLDGAVGEGQTAFQSKTLESSSAINYGERPPHSRYQARPFVVQFERVAELDAK